MNFTATAILALVCVVSASRTGRTVEKDAVFSKHYQGMLRRRNPTNEGFKKALAKDSERERRTTEILGMMAARKAAGKSLYDAEAMEKLEESWNVRERHAEINDTTKDQKDAEESRKKFIPIAGGTLSRYAEEKAAKEKAEREAAEWEAIANELSASRQKIADRIEAERAEGIAADEAERRAKRAAARKAYGL